MIYKVMSTAPYFRGKIDTSTGKEKPSDADLRTNFFAIPSGTQKWIFDNHFSVQRYNSSDNTYDISAAENQSCMVSAFYYGHEVWTYDDGFIKPYLGYQNSLTNEIDFLRSGFFDAEYVRFGIWKSSGMTLYPQHIELQGNYMYTDTCEIVAECCKWRISGENLLHNDLLSAYENAVETPYPSAVWYVENGKLRLSNFIDLPTSAIGKPYPYVAWRIDKSLCDTPFHQLLPIDFEEKTGAFENVIKLLKIRIPASVKKIGRRSFSGTSLKSVKISSDCVFSETSFPESCEINFYEEE